MIYYDTAPFSQAISFGNIVGATNASYSSSLPASAVYSEQAIQMRTTTTP